MKKLLTLVFLALSFSAPTFAGELDDENLVINQNLQQTVIVRVNTQTGEVATLNTATIVKSEEQAKALSQTEFTPAPAEKVRAELDRDAGSSSWYVYWCNYSYAYTPSYYYTGHYYNPYYSYNYGSYAYYYYGSYYRWWR